MSVVEKTLHENYLFFIKELARIDEEIRKLPVGGISPKRIGKSTYYYHQWREGRKVRSVSVGAEAPPELIEGIARRKRLEQQRKDIVKNIAVLAKAVDVRRATADEIVKLWLHGADLIARARGVVVLLTHCERRFSGHPAMLEAYRRFLAHVRDRADRFTFSSPAQALADTA